MPHNLKLWDLYRKNEIDRQTLIFDRFNFVLKPMGITERKDVLAVNNDFLQRTTTKTRLIPGAIELLEYLHPSYRLFILSNGFREVQYKKLKNSGLSPYIEKMILSEDASIQKPHKKIFDYALTNTNSRRKESLMIGDSWDADIAGAYHSHMDQIWLNPEQLPAEGFTPTYTVRALSEIHFIL
jgi:putative hydrolase of the HAD superfamily